MLKSWTLGLVLSASFVFPQSVWAKNICDSTQLKQAKKLNKYASEVIVEQLSQELYKGFVAIKPEVFSCQNYDYNNEYILAVDITWRAGYLGRVYKIKGEARLKKNGDSGSLNIIQMNNA